MSDQGETDTGASVAMPVATEGPAGRVGRRLAETLNDPTAVVAVLFIAAFVARAAWLDIPAHTLIFDEAYYVNAARTLLGWPVAEGAPYAGSPVGLDPNIEHPPLGKLLIAGSMLVFGDTALGWRLPSIVAGMISLWAVYMIVRSGGETVRFALLAVAFLAFDNLTVVHSRIGTLDMIALAAILVGAWLALRDRWAIAGAAVGVGILVRLTAGFGLLALLLLLGWRLWDTWSGDRRIDRVNLRRGLSLLAACAVVSVAGLWLLDARFTTFANPIDHVRHMVAYGSSLLEPTSKEGICAGISSVPWQWPFNECQIQYLRVAVNVTVDGTVTSSVPSVDFRGALNPILASAIPISMLFAVWAAWRTRNEVARWAVVWAAANWIPFAMLSLVNHRVTYIYYFLPVVPAVAVALTILLVRSGLPRFVTWGMVALYAVAFLAYFPFRQIP